MQWQVGHRLGLHCPQRLACFDAIIVKELVGQRLALTQKLVGKLKHRSGLLSEILAVSNASWAHAPRKAQ